MKTTLRSCLASWQPFPALGFTASGPVSAWFYRQTPSSDGQYQRNALGRFWVRLWTA